MVFNATFNNISVISWRVSFIWGENGVLGEYHRPASLEVIIAFFEYMDRRGHDHIVIGFTTTCSISAYYH
jgi:hypothetical protein